MTRYELLDRIGVGGMAEIFRGKAVAAGGFEKPVAIKRILPQLSQDRRFVELLIAEAKILSLLKHRNIVQIFDVGVGDDGKYFLVMELVDGKDLGSVQHGLEARKKRMPLDLALAVGAEICDALEHAHTARGPDGRPMALVHRDVSPTNVLVSRAGEIKLTDFGIAKRAEDATSHGAVRGKFAYISPEQARNEQLNARSDLFAVGLLLWELVTGRRLFSALTDMEALRAVREAKVPLPSSADPRLPPAVDEVLMGALAADPGARYPSAGAFGQRLRAVRYALEVQTGDPATELGKLAELAEQVQRERERAPVRVSVSRINAFPVEKSSEATVIRIHTAESFALPDEDGTGLVQARQVIDKFDEEETRQAQLSVKQVRELRGGRVRETGQVIPPPRSSMPTIPQPQPAPDEEPTAAQPPMMEGDTLPPDSAEATQIGMTTEDMARGVAARQSGLAGPPLPRPVTLPGLQANLPAGASNPGVNLNMTLPMPSMKKAAQPLPQPQQPQVEQLTKPAQPAPIPAQVAPMKLVEPSPQVQLPPQQPPPPAAPSGFGNQASNPFAQPAAGAPGSNPAIGAPAWHGQTPPPANQWHGSTQSTTGAAWHPHTPGSAAGAWRDGTPMPGHAQSVGPGQANWGAPAYRSMPPGTLQQPMQQPMPTTPPAGTPTPAAASYARQNVMLAIGAVIVAALAFVITRMLLVH